MRRSHSQHLHAGSVVVGMALRIERPTRDQTRDRYTAVELWELYTRLTNPMWYVLISAVRCTVDGPFTVADRIASIVKAAYDNRNSYDYVLLGM